MVYGASAIVLAGLLIIFSAPRSSGDVSGVRIGFARYGIVGGKHSLIMIITNGSSYLITRPNGNYELRGESPDGTRIISYHSRACRSGISGGGWSQFRTPNVPCIAPGTSFQYAIPVDKAPYTWKVTLPFETIPLRDRLPYILGSHWPSSKKDNPIYFNLTSSPIPSEPLIQPP